MKLALRVSMILIVLTWSVNWVESAQAQRTAGYEASDEQAWAQTKNQVKGLPAKSSSEYCARAWDLIWPWARDGNMEARQFLHLLIIRNVFTHIPVIPPGEEKTSESWFNNVVTLGIYAHDYSSEEKNSSEDFTKFLVKGFYEKAGLQKGEGKRFYDCVDSGNALCTHLAVEDGLVEPFEEYAKRIDKLLESGIKAKCRGFQ